MIPQYVIATLAVLVVVAIAAIGFATGSYFLHLALVTSPIVFYLINHPSAWFISILAFSQSSLIFPGLPQGLQVVHVLMAGFVALQFGRIALQKTNIMPQKGMNSFFLLCFMAVLLLTAYVRGFGLRALGGESWGGMSYIRLWIGGLFFIFAQSIILTERELKRAVYLMLAFSFLPAIGQLLYVFSGGSIHQQYLFLEAYVGGLVTSLQAWETGGPVRFFAFGTLSSNIIMLTAILNSRNTPLSKIAFALMFALALTMSALSGFRSRVLYVLFILASLLIIKPPQVTIKGLAPFAIILIILIPFLYLSAPHLPGSIQRAFSWLPGIEIPPHIQLEAKFSTINRQRVWELAMAEIPNYIWLGKGFSINPLDLQTPSARVDWVWFSFASHNYHSGPISLLLDTGIFGFLFATVFFIHTIVFFFRQMKSLKGSPLIERAYTFFLAHHLYSVLSFFLIFGDARDSLPPILINLSILRAILNSAFHSAVVNRPSTVCNP